MPKREYVQAKKEIEALMLEDVDCIAQFGISKWSDVWDSSFEIQNIIEDGKVVDFEYSEKALSLKFVLNEGVEKAIEVAKAINTPEFFDYLLGEVKIEGNFKTYNQKHVQTEKKYFNTSQAKAKKYYTSKLLLGLVNIAPEGSQAALVRNQTKGLEVLSFAGVHKNFSGVDACDFDCKNINNFKTLEWLNIYSASGIINSGELTKLTNLHDLKIVGSRLFINENLPELPNLSTLSIESTRNSDLTFLTNLKGLTKTTIWHCKNLISLDGLNFTNTNYMKIIGCDQLKDISGLKHGSKIEELHLSLDSINSNLSELEGLTSCKIMSLSFNKDVDVSFIEKLESLEELTIGSCNFSTVKDFSVLTKMKLFDTRSESLTVFPELGNNTKLKDLGIDAPNLCELKGISNCTNLKKIYLCNIKNLRTINSFPKLKCVDIKFGGVVGLENVDFLENTQIISKFNSSLGYNKELDIREGAFSVSYDRSQEDKKKTGKGLPDGFDKNGHVIPEIFDDGSISDFINVNELDISNFKNLKNLEGLKNITNIMQLNLANCIELKYLKGLEKMLDLREIDLTGCTSLESLHALKNCTKLEKIITLKCDNLKPKPKLKKMDTIEKVQEHLSQL